MPLGAPKSPGTYATRTIRSGDCCRHDTATKRPLRLIPPSWAKRRCASITCAVARRLHEDETPTTHKREAGTVQKGSFGPITGSAGRQKMAESSSRRARTGLKEQVSPMAIADTSPPSSPTAPPEHPLSPRNEKKAHSLGLTSA